MNDCKHEWVGTQWDAPCCLNCGMDYNAYLGDKAKFYIDRIGELKEEIEEITHKIAAYENVFTRIAKAVGITMPVQLIPLAENNEETTAELLAKYIEKESAAYGDPYRIIRAQSKLEKDNE